MTEIALIRDLDGYKAILEEIKEMEKNCKSIDWLIANYGNKEISKIGPLPMAGLITSHILEALRAKIDG